MSIYDFDDYGDYLYEKQKDKKLDEIAEMEALRREERNEMFRQEVMSHQRDYNEAKKR